MTLPTVYEYYTGGGITAGLNVDQPYFQLNNRNISIYSGAMHYFRVPQEYWRDRLRKMRAAGLNTVETYVPWNMHEFQEGIFDIGNGGSDYERFLDIKRFLQIAQEEDMLAIVRPGPYICTELEFGGLPSWLLKNKGIKVRTSDEVFMDYVAKYFRMLFSLISIMQFTNGGPIIAFQIENEYGSVGRNDTDYLLGLKQMFIDNGIKELLFTSDGASIGNLGQIPGVLYTANFGGDATNQLDIMQTYQPGKPSMVMEFWCGWFDHWTEEHHTTSPSGFADVLMEILDYPASVNFYMFHGGTNFGFINGANLATGGSDNAGYMPTTNSYDYDAPLTEQGDYTEKYFIVREILSKYGKNPVRIPDVPGVTIETTAYEAIPTLEELPINDVIVQCNYGMIESEELGPMELMDFPKPGGQQYGYIVYRKEGLDIPAGAELQVLGHVTDTLMVLVNGVLQSPVLDTPADLENFGYWKTKDNRLIMYKCTNCTLDLIVENWGRVNFGGLHQFEQYKGLHEGQVLLNGVALKGPYKVYPMDFPWYLNSYCRDWQPFNEQVLNGPKLYRTVLHLDEAPTKDTYINMHGWSKGIVILNDYVLSRYCKLGPQQTLYLPAPMLKQGDNEILVFEHFKGHHEISFSDKVIYDTIIDKEARAKEIVAAIKSRTS